MKLGLYRIPVSSGFSVDRFYCMSIFGTLYEVRIIQVSSFFRVQFRQVSLYVN